MFRPHFLPVLLVVASCARGPDGCVPDGDSVALHTDVREASGIAWSREHDDIVWVHNDSDGGEYLYAVRTNGETAARVELIGAQNRDWEDIALAPCPAGGPSGDCLFVADIGDNRAARERIGFWIAPEPDPDVDTNVAAVFVWARYPDGARDAEAFAVLEDGSVVVISKGREHPVSVYRSIPLRWPAASGDSVGLRLAHQLSAAPLDLPEQITGAGLHPNGRILGVRSYASIQFYDVSSDTLQPLLEEPVALDVLAEPQGEGIAIGPRGRVLLVSEAGPQGIAPRLTGLRCRFP